MSTSFDTEFNSSLHANVQDNTTLSVSTLLGGAVATVVDIGTSLWNSVPGTPEIETADVLKRVSTDALKVYEENPETIQAASFIGGVFVPSGIALKGMNLMRNGVRGANWFGASTEIGRAAETAKVAKLFEEAGSNSKEYREALKGFYTKTAVNQAIDAVAMEAAIVGLYNAHPYMEDYMADLPKNFAISAAFGGALGGAIGHVADRFALRNVTGGVMTKVFDDTIGEMRPIYGDMPNLVALKSQQINIERLDEIMAIRKADGKNETNDLTFAVAKALKQNTTLEQNELLENILQGELKNLEPAKKKEILDFLVSKNEMAEVENIRLLTLKDVEAEGLVVAPTVDLAAKPSLISVTSKAGPTAPKSKEAVFFPELGLYGSKKDAIHYAGANVYGKTAEQLAKELPSNFHKIPNLDTLLELQSQGSAQIQKQYVATMKRVAEMDLEDLKKIHLSETDGPMITAILYRMATDPAAKNLKIKLFDKDPVYKKILEEKTEQLIQAGKMTAGGPDSSYMAVMDKIGKGNAIERFNPTAGVSGEASGMLSGWIGGGGVARLRRAATDFFGLKTGGFHTSGVSGTHAKDAAIFGELYESAGSKALRAEFAKLADDEGHVYLYRGFKATKLKGHQPVESYTTHPEKARQFGTAKLFKVHVDDIIAGFRDIGPGDFNAEILVRAPARVPVEASLSAQGKQTLSNITTTNKTTISEVFLPANNKTAGYDELNAMLLSHKEQAIDLLVAQGFPAESIALKTNTHIDAVKAYMLVKDQAGINFSQFVPPNQNALVLSHIKNVDDLDTILDPAKMPLVLKGNLKKNQGYTAAHAGLNNQNMHTINKLLTLQTLRASGSQAAKDIAGVLDSFGPALDMVRMQIGKVNNELAGTAFFNSADFFTRKMGDVGPVVSLVGKEFQRIGNEMRNRIVEPLTSSMTAITKDPVGLIEFNTAMNINSALSGWRAWTPEGYLVQKAQKVDEAGKTVTVLERVKAAGSDADYQIKTPAVLELVLKMQDKGKELRDLKNTYRKLLGKGDIADIGFWAPSFNPVNKFIAYAWNNKTDEVQMLWARTKGEFDDIVSNYKKHLNETGTTDVEVYTKDEQKYWSLLNGRLDTINMGRADAAMKKAGKTATPIPKSHQEIFGELAGGYQHYISAEMRNLADVVLADITDPLRAISTINKAVTAGQPFDAIKRAITQPKDSAAVVHNTLLGSHNLGEYGTWQSVNQSFETYLTMAANKMQDVYDITVKPLTKSFLGGNKKLTNEVLNKIDYEQMTAEMAARGVHNPYQVFDDEAAKFYGLSKIEEHKDTAKRVIYASNALAATFLLRVGELAQPLVNAVSMPILTSLAIADKMPATFMGVQKGTAKISGTQVMFEGMRAMNSPLFQNLNKRWEKEGFFTPHVSEVTDLHRASRQFEKGAVAKIENALDHKLVEILSKPSDLTESWTRKAAMNIGAVLAKRLYPELDDTGVTIFARDFMDKSIGNFHASQRPVFFQGTMGVALGLFQTYSLTLAQSIYRHLELKNFKELGKAALLQSGIFGTSSIPGFDQISNAIGENFSNDHYDLYTGTYRATGDTMADFILYGLPSNVGGPSFASRGDANPRPPLLNPPVAWSVLSQTYQSMMHVNEALQAENPEMARALAQALSLQNMSRPIARMSELATGYSITRQGNTVQTPEEVWTATGIIARIMATRPLEEEKLRQADHMRRFYQAADSDNRDAAMNKIRTGIRNGTLSNETIAEAADKYFKNGGTPRGWNSAMQSAIAKTDTSGKETFLMKLQPNSPFNFMIEHLDGE